MGKIDPATGRFVSLSKEDAAEEFWSRVNIPDNPDECWEWTETCFTQGYGSFGWNRRRWAAHRFGYSISHGEIPRTWLVCHTCDNRKCVSPYHLYIGDYADNRRDCDIRGRRNPHVGSGHHNSKLTEQRVEDIKKSIASGVSDSELGRRYGVANTTIRDIRLGIAWKHVK